MLNSFRAKSNCEEEAKFLQERIQLAEKHLADLCDVFGQYARKTARIRDKGDEIAKTVLSFSTQETINTSLAIGLENFADSASSLSDYGDARTRALESKVVVELSQYEDICKRAKEEVKNIFAARDREMQRKKQLDKIRERNPRNRQQIMQAESELVKATAELSKTVQSIEEKATAFERKKLETVKAVLLDFITIEMGYNARVLEVLTQTYRAVDAINEESDLEEFKKSLRLTENMHQPSGTKSLLLKSSQSLGSLGAIFSSSHNKKIPGIPGARSKTNKSEETLDSIKRSASESEDLSTSDEQTSDSDEEYNKESPVIAKKDGKK